MKDKFKPEVWAEIADPATICDRLRGIYRIPIRDGLGPIDGKMTYDRHSQTSPIMHAAADEIEALRAKAAGSLWSFDDLHIGRIEHGARSLKRSNCRARMVSAMPNGISMRRQYVVCWAPGRPQVTIWWRSSPGRSPGTMTCHSGSGRIETTARRKN